jgi:hypothetical protein
MQPRVVAETGVGWQVGRNPVRRRVVGQVLRLEQGPVGLIANLQRIAPIDEDRRLVGQYHRQAGRSGETGQPGQPLRAPGYILALMLVGARHQETVELPTLELGPQGRQPRLTLVTVGDRSVVHATFGQ